MSKPICPENWIDDLSAKIKTIGHPLRLKLLLMMIQEHPCVSELWQCMGEKQPVVSQHLAILKERGIVDSRPQGTRRVYEIIDPEVLRLVQNIFELIPQEEV